MNFAALGPETRIRVILEVVGGPRYEATMTAAATSTERLGKATRTAGENARISQFAYNQLTFTLRRYIFYTTLAVTGLIGALVRLGLQYDSVVQRASIAFKGFMPQGQIAGEIRELYQIAAYSPFKFQDVALAGTRIQALTKNLGLTNTTIKSIVNSLSAFGQTSTTSLNRATIAIQHMLLMGRVTGLSIMQLARDSVPMIQALAKYYGVTTMQMTQMVKSGLIPATTALKAFNQYAATTPGIMNKAIMLQLGTLHGTWITFRDMLAQAMGGATGGVFGGIYKTLKNIDLALAPLLASRKPITLLNIVDAIDKVLSPKTHLILNLFQLMDGVLTQLIWLFKAFAKGLGLVLWVLSLFNVVAGGSKGTNVIMSNLGRIIGTIIFLWGILKLRTLLVTEAQVIYNAVLADTLLETWAYVTAVDVLIPALKLLSMGILTLARSVLVFLLTDPVGWAILLVAALVILYIKWKAFRDIVNETFTFIIKHAWAVAAALTIAFGPIGAALAGLLLVIKYWNQIKAFFGGGPGKPAQPFQPAFSNATAARTAVGGFHPLFPSVAHYGTPTTGARTPTPVSRLPIQTMAKVTPMASPTGMAGVFPAMNVNVQPQAIYFDKRQVGQVMADVVTDKEARS